MTRETKKHKECHKDGQQKGHRPHTRLTTLNLRKKKKIRKGSYGYKKVKLIKTDNRHIKMYRNIQEIIKQPRNQVLVLPS